MPGMSDADYRLALERQRKKLMDGDQSDSSSSNISVFDPFMSKYAARALACRHALSQHLAPARPVRLALALGSPAAHLLSFAHAEHIACAPLRCDPVWWPAPAPAPLHVDRSGALPAGGSARRRRRIGRTRSGRGGTRRRRRSGTRSTSTRPRRRRSTSTRSTSTRSTSTRSQSASGATTRATRATRSLIVGGTSTRRRGGGGRARGMASGMESRARRTRGAQAPLRRTTVRERRSRAPRVPSARAAAALERTRARRARIDGGERGGARSDGEEEDEKRHT